MDIREDRVFSTWIKPRVFWVTTLVGVLLLFYLIKGVVFPFILAFFIAYLLNPTVQRLETWGLPRWLGAFISLVIIFAVLAVAIAFTIPWFHKKLSELIAGFPYYAEHFLQSCGPLLERILKSSAAHFSPDDYRQLKTLASASVRDMLHGSLHLALTLLSQILAVANVISFFFIAPAVAFYLLKDWKCLWQKGICLLPIKTREPICRVGQEIHSVLGAYAKGQALVCSVLMIYYATGLFILGLTHGIAIGMITGLLAFIPYIGFFIGFTLALALSLINHTTAQGIYAIVGLYATGYALEGFFLTPQWIGQRAGLHPVWVIFALFVGANLFGVIGILFALPTAAAFGVCLRALLRTYQQSSFYNT